MIVPKYSIMHLCFQTWPSCILIGLGAFLALFSPIVIRDGLVEGSSQLALASNFFRSGSEPRYAAPVLSDDFLFSPGRYDCCGVYRLVPSSSNRDLGRTCCWDDAALPFSTRVVPGECEILGKFSFVLANQTSGVCQKRRKILRKSRHLDWNNKSGKSILHAVA